jgi:hypothetical protein
MATVSWPALEVMKFVHTRTRTSSPCHWATTRYENGGPVKVVILWNYESVN